MAKVTVTIAWNTAVLLVKSNVTDSKNIKLISARRGREMSFIVARTVFERSLIWATSSIIQLNSLVDEMSKELERSRSHLRSWISAKRSKAKEGTVVTSLNFRDLELMVEVAEQGLSHLASSWSRLCLADRTKNCIWAKSDFENSQAKKEKRTLIVIDAADVVLDLPGWPQPPRDG